MEDKILPSNLQGNVWQSNRRATNWIIEDDKALNKFKYREKKKWDTAIKLHQITCNPGS